MPARPLYRALLVALLSLTTIGCASQSPNPSPSASETSVVETDTPTAKPTPPPTPRPTPTPDPRASEVLDHLRSANSELLEIITGLTDAAAALDMATVQVQGRALSDFALADLKWIGNADIPDCLAPVFAKWGEALLRLSGAGTLYEVGAGRSDAEALALGTQQHEMANAALTEVTELIIAAQLTC